MSTWWDRDVNCCMTSYYLQMVEVLYALQGVEMIHVRPAEAILSGLATQRVESPLNVLGIINRK